LAVLFTVRVARDRPSQMDGSQRFGPNVAQARDEFRGPGLCCVLSFRAGWSRPYFVSLGRNLVRILKFSVFSFLGKHNI
jgi:hypothetical protein